MASRKKKRNQPSAHGALSTGEVLHEEEDDDARDDTNEDEAKAEGTDGTFPE